MKITTRVTGFKIHDCNVDELQEGETVALIKEGERIAVYHDYLGLNRFRIGFVPDDFTTPQIDAMMNRTDSRVVAVIEGIYDGKVSIRDSRCEVSIDVYTVIHSLDRNELIKSLSLKLANQVDLQLNKAYCDGYRTAINDAIKLIETE